MWKIGFGKIEWGVVKKESEFNSENWIDRSVGEELQAYDLNQGN